MDCKDGKQIRMTVFEQNYVRKDWSFDFDGAQFLDFYDSLSADMGLMGINLELVRNRESSITVNSYADLLNVIKLSSLADGHANQCIGHIIGKSPNLNILEDIRLAVRRIAFAPETVAPSSEFRKVCHNCGCGC